MFLTISIFAQNQQQVETKQIQKKSQIKIKKPEALIKDTTIIATLTKNSQFSIFSPSHYCLSDEAMLYKGFDYRIGGTNVFYSGENIKDFENSTIKLTGIYKKDLTQKITKSEKCNPLDYAPMMQLRSDWTSPECGNKVGVSTKEKLKSLEYFEINTIEKTNFFEVKKEKSGKYYITINNILNSDIENLEIVFHYESLHGKPSPDYKNEIVKLLKKNKTKKIEFKLFTTKEKEYKLNSIEINYKKGLNSVIIDYNTSDME